MFLFKFGLLLVVLFFLCSVADSVPQKRIVNGSNALQESEYAVHVTSSFNNDQLVTYGGGTLISYNVVITAATVVLGYSHFVVRFGETYYGDLHSVLVTETAVHPNYEQRNQLHDIAFLRLAMSVDEIAPGVMHPVQINHKSMSSSSSDSSSSSSSDSSSMSKETASVEGGEEYGFESKELFKSKEQSKESKSKKSSKSSKSKKSSKSSKSSSSESQLIIGLIQGFGIISMEPPVKAVTLQQMHQTVIKASECRSRLGTRSSILMDSHFCAMDQENLASGCIFDQGNGFIISEDGFNVIVGVLSLVTNMCRPQFPTIYTRVSDYTELIEHFVQLWQ